MRAVLSLVLAGVSACAAAPPPQPVPAAARQPWPAMAWVPPDASYALVGARTADLIGALRELLAGIGLFADQGIGDIDRDLRRVLGASPLAADELDDAGIDLDRGAAIWSTGLWPTLALPVRDRDALAARIDARLPARRLSVRRIGDHDLYRWRAGSRHALEWVLTGDWLLVRVGPRREPIGAWAEPLVAGPPRGRTAPPDLIAAMAAGTRRLIIPPDDAPPVIDIRRARPGVVGMARIERLWPRVRALLPSAFGACGRALAPRGRILLAADLSVQAGSGVISVELDDRAAAALAGALAPPPPPGYVTFRDHAPIWLELGLDPRWPFTAAARAGCKLPALPRRIAGLVDGVVGARVAVTDVQVAGRRTSAALHLRLSDPAALDRLIARIPFTRRGARTSIGGVAVDTIVTPLLRPIHLHTRGDEITIAAGHGVMELLLGPGPAPEPGATVLAAGITPDQIPQLSSLLSMASTWLGLGGNRYFDRTAQRLLRWESGRIRLFLDGRELVLTLAMRLTPTGR